MGNICRVKISKKEYVYLQSRNILKQFKKASEKIKSSDYTGLDLKKREPKSDNIWSFRITKKYRALATKSGQTLKVFPIDDHQ